MIQPTVVFDELQKYYRLASGATNFNPLHIALTEQTFTSTKSFCKA